MASNFSCLIANFSENSVTPSAWTPQRSSFYNRYIVIIVNLLFFVIGTPWNTYVIVNIIRKHLSTQPTMMLLLSLATADLLICVLVMPVTIITGIADSFVFGSTDYVRCQVCQLGLLFIIFSFASLYTLALISLDRFVYIWKPLRYKRFMTVRLVRSLIVAAWLLSTAVSVTPLFGFGVIIFSKFSLTCSMAFRGYSRLAKNTSYLILLILVGLVPIVTLIVTNVWVFCIALKSTRRHYKMMNQKKYVEDLLRRVNQEKNKRQTRLIKMFIAILVSNVVTWIPVLVILIARVAYEPDSSFPTDARIFMVSFSYLTLLSQSVLHPMIESRKLFSIMRKMTNALRRICNKSCCISCRCNENVSDRCCGKRCVLLDIINAAFLPAATEQTGTSTLNTL